MLLRSSVGITLVHSQFKMLGAFAIKSSVYLKLEFLERKSSWNKFSSFLPDCHQELEILSHICRVLSYKAILLTTAGAILLCMHNILRTREGGG